ncbi:Phosphate ABC transporter, periplasmic phosphate-binding protein PstS (TC 3.A.1.7.1) [hydrothermal vent metagenome]|uniref:Phosphate ABC transporter, periplasmic phosphate-binding protein PstS (TC 3.A.1.7.1) n=1 Tax=hydrothermal vent metagenome TaxID=652676 RepID=A0A3B1AEA1_9ZZZZ
MKLQSLIISLLVSLSITSNALAAKSTSLNWSGCGITKKAFMTELANAYQKKTGIKINLRGGGATRGIRDVVKKKAHIGGACRAQMELNSIERKAQQVPVAWDALVVIVHPSNPVKEISLLQLRDIYRGKITNWKQLGGRSAPIDLYARTGKISGVGFTLRELVFNNLNEAFKAKRFFKSTGPLEKAIEENINAIGSTGISSAKRRDIKILNLEGKEPSYENIRQGKYLLYRPLYLVIRQFEKDKRITGFKRFALSKEGQAIIREAGSVPYADAVKLVMNQLIERRRAAKIE